MRSLSDANKAIEVRKRMIKTIRYAVDDKSRVMREVDDIELGAGYEGSANDPVRVVDIYLAHKKAVTIDKKNYRSTDVAEAQSLIVAIRSEIRAFAAKEPPFADLKKRAFTELSRLYKELRAAGKYVFRHRQDIVDDLPALHVAMGIIFSRRTAPAEEKTGDAKPEPKGEAKPEPKGEAKPAPKGEAKPKPEDDEDGDE